MEDKVLVSVSKSFLSNESYTFHSADQFCDGKPFGSLGPAFAKYFDKNLSRLNLNVTTEDLFRIINPFEVLLGKKRSELIRYVIGMRWENVRRKILS